MTMADLCTASGSVCLVTAGVFEVVCATSGRAAAKRIKAREIFMVGAALSVTENLLLCTGRAELRSRAPLGEGADGGPKLITASDAGAQIVAVHHRDHFQLDLFGAYARALADIRAAAEGLGVHLRNHAQGTAVAFRLALGQDAEVGNLGSGKERGGGIRAGGNAGSAADAGGRVHGAVSGRLADEMSVAIGRVPGGNGDVATGGNDAVEGAAIDHQILDQRESRRAPGFDDQFLSVLEVAHGQLADSGGRHGTMRDTIDHEAAGTTDA